MFNDIKYVSITELGLSQIYLNNQKLLNIEKWFNPSEKYTDCVREYQTITDCLIFQNSFKLGARMMLEVMEDN